MSKDKYPVSPLRYPGAKRWMVRYIHRAIETNGLQPHRFFEPFAGGATVSLALLSANVVDRVVLNDKDPLVAAFWKVAIFDSDWLVNRIANTEVTLEEWERQKAGRFRSAKDKAFQCLFLNRTSFSGILTRRAGPIGGKTQRSDYKIDCRFNKETIIRRILTAANFRNRVDAVWCEDWKLALQKFESMSTAKELTDSFVYLDPPFFNKADSLYNYIFDYAEHIKLKDALADLNQPWLLSYDLCPQSTGLYGNGTFSRSSVNIIYSTSSNLNRSQGKELIVSNLNKMVSEIQPTSPRQSKKAQTIDSSHAHLSNAPLIPNPEVIQAQ